MTAETGSESAEVRRLDGGEIGRLADGVREPVIAWQRAIHADPEIGFDTVRTAALVSRGLREAGIAVREGIGRTGVVGDIDVPGATKRIAFRADMDALPMDEDNDLPHKSRNKGAAHMCGHDAHTAMLLGAATALSGARDTLSCSLRFIFQPNEEALPGGAPAMIEDGCLEGVDRCWEMKSPRIRQSERAAARAAYDQATEIYERILQEARRQDGL